MSWGNRKSAGGMTIENKDNTESMGIIVGRTWKSFFSHLKVDFTYSEEFIEYI